MKTFLTWKIQRSLFPAWLLAAGFTAMGLYHRGASPAIITIAIGLASLTIVGLLERIMSYRKDWNENKGDIQADLISFGLLSGIVDPLLKTFGAALALYLSSLPGLPFVTLFPVYAPFALQVTFVFLIAEFGKYWSHRFHHENAMLWKMHAMHHVPERLYFLNNFKLHPVNHATNYLFSLFPLSLIGAPIEAMLIYAAVAVAVSFFQHANIDLKFGLLNYVFSTNTLHRWHHSKTLPEGNRNYGSVLIVWDIVFGTFHFPDAHTAPTAIGIQDCAYPQTSYIKQLLWPFTVRCCPA